MPGVPCPTSGSSLLNLPLSGSAPFGGCRSLLPGLLPLSCPAVTPDPVFTYCPKTLGRSLGLACNTASHRPFADGAGRTRVFASPGWVPPPHPPPASQATCTPRLPARCLLSESALNLLAGSLPRPGSSHPAAPAAAGDSRERQHIALPLGPHPCGRRPRPGRSLQSHGPRVRVPITNLLVQGQARPRFLSALLLRTD